MKRTLALLFALILVASLCAGCKDKKEGYDFGLNKSKQVTLTIWGSMTDFPALEPVILDFEKEYPNCTVIYKMLDGFDKNIYAKMQNETQSASMFLGYRETFLNNPGLDEFALDFSDYESVGVDMSQLNQVLTASAKWEGKQLAIPLGLESRGLAVNTTLLAAHGLKVPTNYDEFVAACDKLAQAGLVPIQTYHDECVIQLIYPYVANTIVHGADYETVFASMNAKDAGTSKYLTTAFDMLDDFVRRGFISYKENERVVASHYGVEGSYQAAVMNFLEGDVAFSPMTASNFCSIAPRETLSKEFTASPFEYQYIAAPLAKDGSYGYLQPWLGVCINKRSDNVNWSRAFVNFLCKKENIAAVAERKGYIPNTVESVNDKRFDSILALDDKHITNLSMFTNTFYSALKNTLVRLAHPFEYIGVKGEAVIPEGQACYTAKGVVYTPVDDVSALPDGEELYIDCYKKRFLTTVSDAGFAPGEGIAYFILSQGAYRPVADVSALPEGERIYIDEFKQAGTLGDGKFTPDAAVAYYLLTDVGFEPAQDIGQVLDGTKVFIPEARVPYRMNSATAPSYYEGQIGH